MDLMEDIMGSIDQVCVCTLSLTSYKRQSEHAHTQLPLRAMQQTS